MMLHQAGMQNVSQQRLTIPVGTWGGRVGKLMAKDVLAIIETTRALLCTALPLSPKHVDAVLRNRPGSIGKNAGPGGCTRNNGLCYDRKRRGKHHWFS